jgi:thymidine kinase
MEYNINSPRQSTQTTTTTNTTNTMARAYLEIIVGPMFSGKTSKLAEIYKQCMFCSIPVAVINYALDTRYHDTMLSTHDKHMIPCIQTMSLAPMWETNDQVHCADVILINEGQFFDDLYPVVESMLKAGKKIYISGLDGDFQRKKFGQILDLIPLCDKVTKLTSLCSICKTGEPGIFSMRLTSETQQTLIGSDNYAPVCRNCYQST